MQTVQLYDPFPRAGLEDLFRGLFKPVQVARDAAELQEVEAALTRIKGETYGTCIECGMPIPRTRLDVAPMAARCIACQEKLETAMRRAGAGTI